MVQQPNDPLSGLLGALLGGHPNVQDHMSKTGQSLDDVLGTLSGGPATGDQSQGSLGDLLGSMMGGNVPTQGAGGDPLRSILGGLLGGAAPQGEIPAQGASGDPLGSILDGLLGGATPQGGASAGGDPMSAILGSLLSGGMQGGAMGANPLGSNAFLAPIVEAIPQKLGIGPQIAATVVSFGLNALMSGALGGRQGLVAGSGSNALVDRVSSGKPLTQKYLKESGLLADLTAQTGLDQKTAAKSLQTVFQAFGTQMGTGSIQDRQEQFNTLLKSWQ